MPATKVANGQATDAGQFNGLVDDVDDITIGHAHTGAVGGGKQVSHGDLTDAALGGTGLTHAQINAHIGASPGSGSSGVHGLTAGVYVPGITGSQLTFEAGYTAKTTNDLVNVTTTLNTILGVVASLRTGSLSPLSATGPTLAVYSLTNAAGASSFQVRLDSYYPENIEGIYWIAWGTK